MRAVPCASISTKFDPETKLGEGVATVIAITDITAWIFAMNCFTAALNSCRLLLNDNCLLLHLCNSNVIFSGWKRFHNDLHSPGLWANKKAN